MVFPKPSSESDLFLCSNFASRYARDSLPRFSMPENSMPKEAAYQNIHDELQLDAIPKLNLASFVTTSMEEECNKLIMESINKNYVDMDEYPATTDLHNRCVNMIARMFHAEIGENENATGAGTVGSSEAIMLAGLAFKKKWQNKRKAEGKPYDKPNLVTGSNVQVCWEKFARYFEVELREVEVREGYYVMDPAKAVELVDENTICVAAILGSTYNGEFEDVKLLNDLLLEKTSKLELEWDFRLPLVKSINVSGHKYGLVYAGIGWVIWRTKDDLPEDLVFHINYLGADQPTFTLNFSKDNAMVLKESLEKSGHFNILSKDNGVPVVAFSLKDRSQYDEYKISEMLRRHGWIVPAYPMPPAAQHINVLRVVIRAEFSRTLAERLVFDIYNVLHELEKLHPPKVTNFIKEENKALVETGVKKTALDAHREIIAQESNKRQKIMAA
ncbi:hypothetical protein JHK82_044067 [Glycine max]|nr:hypothetical protein JHK82_044067 [Glycine max]